MLEASAPAPSAEAQREPDQGTESPAAGGRRPLIAGLAYLAVFAILLRRLIAAAATSLGAGNNPLDSRLATAIQAWVARALATAPSALFDAPFYYPAPAQLTDNEHFLTSQLLFAPVFWSTGNPVLASNVVVLASYPLAAFAMERLLAALGIAAVPAWVGGLVFALGPLGTPATNQLFQYLVFFLPLVALALRRLRERPTWGRSACFGAIYLLALLSAYYASVVVTIVAVVWTALELLRPEPGRLRFVGRLIPAAGIAVTILLVFSAPYITRRWAMVDYEAQRAEARTTVSSVSDPSAASWRAPEHGASALAEASTRPIFPWKLLWVALWPPKADPSPWLAACGLLALVAPSPSARRTAFAGSVFVVLTSGVFVLILSGVLVPAVKSLGFFRNVFRLVVVTGFGVALLSAAALGAARESWGPRVGLGIAAIAALLVLLLRGTAVVAPVLDRVDAVSRDAATYRVIGELTASAGGALLELPLEQKNGESFVPEAMVAIALHGRPVLTGFGAGMAFHWRLVGPAIARLPEASALAELVDMTHLRWVLLRPADEWADPARRARIASGLVRVAGGPQVEIGGFLLQRVDLPERHPQWFAGLARGYRRGESLLGTPYSADGAPPVGAIRAPAASEVEAAGLLWLPVEIANDGAEAWPGALTPGAGTPGEVYVSTAWRLPAGPSNGAIPGPDQGLRRDLPPGERLADTLALAAPKAPGEYELTLRVARRAGPAAPPTRVPQATVRVLVKPRSAPPAAAPPQAAPEQAEGS